MTDGPSAPTTTTKLALALAANGVCEFRGCGAPLQISGTIVGEIAHIHSPRPDGPRYDPNVSPQQLHSLSNLMYLCGTHHGLVDKNECEHTAEQLRQMKTDHEEGNYLVTAGVLQQLLDALEGPTVPENWWERPGAPVFMLNLASNKRADGHWTFEAAPSQIDGGDIGNLRYRWLRGNDDPPFETPNLIRARHWQLKALDFSPKGEPLRLELSFWWHGAERRYAHFWQQESQFQSADVEVVRS